MMNSMKQFFAVSLVLVSIGGLVGCSKTNERTTSYRTETQQPAASNTATTNTERPVSDQQANNVSSNEEASNTAGTGMSQTDRSLATNPPSTNMTKSTNATSGPTHNTMQTTTTTTSTSSMDQNDKAVMKKVEAMRPGKKPFEYISSLSQLGTVTDYHYDKGSTNAKATLDKNNKQYNISMNVDPKKQTVTKLMMNK